jgi:4-cresol dehydrogenase (hydroxylating) flavoprotein subunit
MDLSRLNQIIDYNEKLAYITVEPGVTFQQAYEYLCNINSNLFISTIGGSPDSSLIGNALERGDGDGPYGNRIDFACGLEIILPTGEIIHTGFDRFENSKTAPLSRWGVGPAFDGIFSQSNLGIVTKMTFWLTPIPQYYQSFTCRVQDHSGLKFLIDQVQKLILQGIIPESCFCIWNSYKILAKKGRYPWKFMKQETPLNLKDLKGVEPWEASGELYSPSKEIGLAQKSLIKEALKQPVQQLKFYELQENQRPFGVPTNDNVKSTYWRKKTAIPEDMNPDLDGCGVLWLCPLLPFDGTEVVNAVKITESIIKVSGFEPNIAIKCINARSVYMYIAIMYDREVSGEDDKAKTCHDQLLNALIEAGYLPYRLGIQSMDTLPRSQDDYGKLLQKIKQSLDPNNILAPGRYDFRKDWSEIH